MDMNTIEADVDAARSAADRVRGAREKATELKDATMQITGKEAWVLRKTIKRFREEAEQVMLEARTAYEEVSKRWRAVEEATNAHIQVDELAALAQRTARCAYEQANKDMNIVSQLVCEVTQNCKDAWEIFAENNTRSGV